MKRFILLCALLIPLVCGAQDDRDLYRTAAQQGDADAQFNMGLIHYEGRGVPQDFEKAEKWFKKAANKDHAAARYYRGLIYQKGQGVKRDDEKAQKFFELAAQQGYVGTPEQPVQNQLIAEQTDVPASEQKVLIRTEPKFVLEDNPLYGAIELTAQQMDFGWHSIPPAFWIRMPSSLGEKLLYSEKLRFMRIGFEEDANLAVADYSALLSASFAEKLKSQTADMFSVKARAHFKIDANGKVHSLSFSDPRLNWYTEKRIENEIGRSIMSALVFQPIRSGFPSQADREYWVSISLNWSETPGVGRGQNGDVNMQVQLRRERERLEKLTAEFDEQLAKIAEHRASEQKVEAEKQARLERQTRQQEERERIFGQSVEQGSRPVVWSSGPAKRRSTYPDMEVLYNKINEHYQQASRISSDERKFAPPSKGEFEKSGDYAVRVKQAEIEFEKSLVVRSEQLTAGRGKILEGLLGEYLGSASVASVAYDADKEIFSIQVADKTSLSLSAKLPVPIADAPKLKKEIESSKPWVLFSFDEQENLRFTALVLQSSSTTLTALPAKNFQVDMTTARLKAYEQKAAQEKMAADKAYQEHKRKADAERRLRRQSWPSDAIAEMFSGAVLCETQKGAHRARAIEGNPHVEQALDCWILPSDRYVVESSYLAGGISRVRMRGAVIYGYTPSHNVAE